MEAMSPVEIKLADIPLYLDKSRKEFSINPISGGFGLVD